MALTTGVALRAAVRAAWTSELGFEDDAGERGAEARERAAAMATLAGILDDLVGASASLGRDDLLAAFARRAADEDAAGAADGGGVELATYHRAKGLEWDAVFLPMLEDGSLPIRQAFDDEEALEEERRLLYVGITRARVHLALSWAERRGGARRPSRFIAGLGDRSGIAVIRPVLAGDPRPKGPRSAGALPDTPAIAALRAWRTTRAKADEVPAYVVAHDATLLAIAEARPTTLAALSRVKGMGPTKLDRYGAEILAALGAATADD
jgi:DNA helicase-2/ATP-dependent DNA helicase PcrA